MEDLQNKIKAIQKQKVQNEETCWDSCDVILEDIDKTDNSKPKEDTLVQLGITCFLPILKFYLETVSICWKPDLEKKGSK